MKLKPFNHFSQKFKLKQAKLAIGKLRMTTRKNILDCKTCM